MRLFERKAKSPNSEKHSERSLLLEQLESRCMLAGGVFLFAQSPDNVDRDLNPKPRPDGPESSNSGASRPGEVRTYDRSGQRSDLNRPADHRHRPQHRKAFRPPASDNLAPSVRVQVVTIQNTSAPSVNTPPLANATPQPSPQTFTAQHQTAQQQAARPVSPPAGNPQGNPLATSLAAQQRNPPEALPSLELPVVNSRDVGVAATDALPSAEAGDVVRQSDAVADAIASVFESSPPEIQVIPWDQPQDLDSADQAFGAAGQVDSTPEEPGLVDLLPLLGEDRGSSQGQDPTDLWKMSDQTLEALREIQAEPGSLPGEAQDLELRKWLESSGGLVSFDIRHVSKYEGLMPSSPDDIGAASRDVNEIALDAAHGLHRTLDLIASSESQVTRQAVRDAVLATLAAEQADIVAPVDTAKNRLSAFAYPGAAIAAGMLALVNRKRQSGDMVRTHPSPRRSDS